MKLRFGIFLTVTAAATALSCASAALGAQAPAAQPTPAAQATPAAQPSPAVQTTPAALSTWSGIYTKDQAGKGETIYAEKCASCHGANAGGADAPTLAGGEFASNWDGLNVGQLFDRVRNTMPQDDPQSLSREDTSALLAFMFVKNGFPSGETPLPMAGDALGPIKYLANKP